MHPFLASDFPNLATVLIGLPLLVLSMIIAPVCIYHRWQAVAVGLGVVCVLAGGLLYLTVSGSGKDYMLTAIVAGLLFIIGIVLLVAKRPADPDDNAAS